MTGNDHRPCKVGRILGLAAYLLAVTGWGGSAWALSCLSQDPRVPVFVRSDSVTGKPTMTTAWSTLGAPGAHGSVGIFYAVPPAASGCPTGTNPIRVFYNADKDAYVYAANPALPVPVGSVEQAALPACIAGAETGPEAGSGEAYSEQSCDVPLFRDEVMPSLTAPAPRTQYRTSISDHHGCTSDPACTGTYIGRVYPGPVDYVMRRYAEPYVVRAGGTTIARLQDGHSEVTTVDLPFPFTFFGQTRHKVKISTNGMLTFNPSSDDTTDATAVNTSLQAPGPPRDLIAGWWTDSGWTDGYRRDSDSTFLYILETDQHVQRFIVQWGDDSWGPSGQAGNVRNMQIHLIHPIDGSGQDRIEIHYGRYLAQSAFSENATVGIMAPYLSDATGSQTGLGCSPNCHGPDGTGPGDWTADQVTAFITKPTGYIVSEALSEAWFQPLDVREDIAVTKKSSDSVWVDIGFPFEFNGRKYSRVGVSTAGVMMFDRLPAAGPADNPLTIPPAVGAGVDAIAPWWDHLSVDTNFVPNNIGILARRIDSGLPGGRQFTVEWRGLVNGPGDASHRQMQVTLFEDNNRIAIQYGESGWSSKSPTRDHPTVGILGVDPTGIDYRLVNCADNCSEVQRSRLFNRVTGLDRPAGWPLQAKFILVPDPAPRIDWHLIYRAYFMADDFAAGSPSKGFCGNCHAELHVPEQELYDALFYNFEVPIGHGWDTDCLSDHNPGSSTGPMLSLLTGTNLVDPVKSRLVNADITPISWMTEPAGNFNSVEASMPWSTWCQSRQRSGAHWAATFNAINVLDEAKSRIRRWLLLGAP